ncbi:hypothetical protein GCM10009424_34060 [Sphingomonas ursincola]|uniref:Glycerophosphoryl diester phosphodiesterase membrane domain-containing protein n=1 Tax=Sphingomonas ursincola TaxID=56361 RepID=A0A7V8U6W8_9SPHN|nr:hypothetical protein [Sphingomonas ursincola]MBA1372860.1 hypothetical protein [Sphingomonas ursincola]
MAGTAEKISIANVITNSFGLLGRHALVFFGFPLLLFGVPSVAIRSLFGLETDFGNFNGTSTAYAIVFGYALAMLAVYGFLQALLMLVAAQDLARQPSSLANCIAQAVRKLPGLFGLGFVVIASFILIAGVITMPVFGFSLKLVSDQNFAGATSMFFTMLGLVLIGMIAFTYLSLMWMVAIPAKVVEPIGVFAALGRSRRLTAGSRLRLLLLIIILFFFNIAVSLPLGLIAQFGPVVEMIATVLSSAINIAFASALVASAYIELRAVKEGASTDELADVFA